MESEDIITIWIFGAVISIIIAAFLAIIPATIAKRKGKSYGVWWFYGWMLFIVALIHSLLLEDETEKEPIILQVKNSPLNQSVENKIDEVELLKKYKQLFDDGIITKEEYDIKRKQILDI